MQTNQANIWKFGKAEPLPENIPLIAGRISLTYEQGFLRYIKVGSDEILRMINHAVRDHNWNTIPLTILQQEIKQHSDSFSITYVAEAKQGDIHFIWNSMIEGKDNSQIIFTLQGEAQTTFRRNRIGFTVLHPVSECTGSKVRITHPNGQQTEDHFPVLISPHQPFLNIQVMEWEINRKIAAKLEFEGDIFETEDQRNWIDDSYKTYCTPLDLPFPVLVEKGDQITQKITLTVAARDSAFTKSVDQIPYSFKLDSPPAKLPLIGVGQSTEIDTISEREASLIKALGFDHYQVDLKLYEAHWRDHWRRTQREVDQLDIPLELNLFFDEISSELPDLIKISQDFPIPINMINVFQRNAHVTQQDVLEDAIPLLRTTFPEVNIGTGTNAFFTELNRERVDLEKLDFLVYSINPQVHAFDNLSLVETLNAIPYTAKTAQDFAKGKPVHISPITFKMRWNPNATGESVPLPGQLPDDVDVRQMSLFGASWLLGCINSLVQSEVEAVTFFETIGLKGIMQSANPSYQEIFHAPAQTVYPMYFIFYLLNRYTSFHCYPVLPSDKMVMTGLAFEDTGSEQISLLLSNLTNFDLAIDLPSEFQDYKGSIFHAENIEGLIHNPGTLEDLPRHQIQKSFTLPPYAILWLE